MIRQPLFFNLPALKVGSYLPAHRDQDTGAYLSSGLHFKGVTLGPRKRPFCVVKLARGWEKIYISKGQKRIYNSKYLKWMLSENEGQGPRQSQEKVV